MVNRLRRFLLVAFLLAVPTHAFGEASHLYYTVETLQWGTAPQRIAMPRTFPSSPDMTASQVVAEAFHRLKSFRGSVYSNASLTLDPSFASTGAASVTLGEIPPAELPVMVSEVYWTLVSAAVREIRIAEVGKDAITAEQVPFGAAGIVAQLWQILPPGQPGPGLTHLDGQLVPAAEVRRRLDGKDKAVVAAIFSLLQSPMAYVRLQIVTAIAAMNLAKTETALIPLLRDPDATVKTAVLKGFEGTRSKPVLAALEQVVQSDPDPVMQSAAARILSAAGVSQYAVIILYDKLKDNDDGVVMDAIEKLSKGGKPEVAIALADVLRHRNARVRAMAMKAIVGLGNPDALRKVVESADTDMKFRNEAAALLAAGSGEDVDRGVRHLLVHGGVDEQVKAIAQVAEQRRYKLVADVLNLLASGEQAVRLAAADALAGVKDSKALEPLAVAVVKFPADSEKLEAAVIAVFGGLSVDEVIRFSEHTDRVLRQLSIKSLSKFNEDGRAQPRILEVLKKRLGDSDQEIRRSAAFALARIKDAGVVESLVKLVDDPDGTIREQVAIAVGRSSHPQAEAILTKCLEDLHVGTRVAAIDGLRERKVKETLEKLRMLVEYREPEVRRAAIRATVELTGPEDWEKWWQIWSQRLYDQEPEVKVWAIRGVASQKAPQVPGLLQPLVLDPSEDVRLAALKALGASGQKEAIEYIASALSDEKVGKKTKMAALDALDVLHLEDCAKPIMEFVKNEKDPDLRQRANEVYDSLQ